MSETAAPDHDPESLDTALINSGKPPRQHWIQIILALRAHTIFNSTSTSIFNNAQERSLASSRVSSFSPSYSALETHDAGEAEQDQDPESLETGLINPGKSPRHHWLRVILALRAQVIFNSTSTSIVNSAQEQSFASSRASSFSPSHVSLQITSDSSENQNCSTQDQLILDNIARMVKKKDLVALNAFGGVQGIALALHTDLANGIHDIDVLFRSVTNTYCNPQSPEQRFFHFLFKACNNSTIFLLFLCAMLSFGFGIKEEGPENGWYDGVTTLLAVLILVSITSVGNCWRARKLKKQSDEKKITCETVRGGKKQEISISDILVGDIICLTMGNQLPADGLFIEGESLTLDDRPELTIDDQNPFVSSGTEVIKGHGRMLATSVGKKTALSEMMMVMSQETCAPDKKNPLQARLDKVSNCIQITALLISILSLVVLFLRYEVGKKDDENERPEIRGKPTAIMELMNAMEKIIIRPRGPISILATSLAVCLVGLQEGLSLVVILGIAYWNKKASSKATVRELLACVNMGLVTTICTEKTGGLMLNQMEVDMFGIGEEITSEEPAVDPAVHKALCHGIVTLVMAPHTSHSSIEDSALIRWVGSKLDTKMESLKQSCSIIEPKRSNSNGENCCVLVKKNGDNEKNMWIHCKGHAATILAKCSHYYDSKGAIKEIDEQRRMVFEQMIKDMGAKHLKTIALAHKQTDVELLEEDNLILIALLGLKKRDFTKAGVDIRLVSGDNVAFGEINNNECGLLMPNSDRMKVEGEKFRHCTDNERKEMVDRIVIMENANPSDKVLLVRYLRQKGYVVAVVGVGTNDVPALKEADVGLTMQTGSTKLARESSAIIWDGSFKSLFMFLMYGRCVYSNIQKFIQVDLTMVIAGLLIISITTISFGDGPITTIQLFWVNLIVPFLGGLALLTEPATEKLMDKPSVSQIEPLITKPMWRNIVTQALYQTAILVTFQFEGQAILHINDRVSKTMIFNSFVLCQVFNNFNARELEKKNVFKGIDQNYLFWVAVGTTVVLQVAFIEIAAIVSITARLNCVHWVICFLIGTVPWVIDLVGKCTWDFFRDWIIGPLSLRNESIHKRPSTPTESASILEPPLINGESMAIQS